MHILTSGEWLTSVGDILTSLVTILGVVGGGIAYLIRSRRAARRERLRTETAAGLAAAEAKKQLEAKLEKQHNEIIKQYEDRLEDMESSHTRTIDQYKQQIIDLNTQYQQQIADLVKDRENLLNRLLDREKPKE